MEFTRRDDVNGIETRYELDGPGIESPWKARFSASLQTSAGLLQNGYRVSFPGAKRPRCGINHPPPSSAEVKEIVELYFYFSCEPSWTVVGRTLPLLHGVQRWFSRPDYYTPGEISPASHPISLKYMLLLHFHLHLGLPNDLLQPKALI
jgi:hypothetical protein